MALVFTLPWFKVKTPAPSLGGRTRRYKPIVPILVNGPRAQLLEQAVVDTGADDVVFPIAVASSIGIDLSVATPAYCKGIGSPQSVLVLFAPVILTLNDGKEQCRWYAVVGFTQVPLQFGLFGIAGGLEHFRTTLDVVDQQIIIEPKPTLPATQALAP
jgi:hypothetical protein